AAFGPVGVQYDPICGGGTSNIIFDLAQEKFTSAIPSQSGSIRNCTVLQQRLCSPASLKRPELMARGFP
ncbi:MAG: hypothetical protein ACRD88_04445, partial [Terriglobia bacterium]